MNLGSYQVSSFGKLIPALLVIIGIFAVYQLVAAVVYGMRQAWGFAGLYLLMSIAGAALARTLWINRRKLAPPE